MEASPAKLGGALGDGITRGCRDYLVLTSRIPKYAISGLRSIAAILAFAAGMVAILYAIPTIYGSFNIVYLSTNIEFHQYVIRIWPPALFLLLIYTMISLSLKISPINCTENL